MHPIHRTFLGAYFASRILTYIYQPICTYFPKFLLTYLQYLLTYLQKNHFFKVGVFSNCDRTDKWSWTAQGSLKFKNKYCLKPKSGWTNPLDNVNLVLSSACESQNFFEFVPSKYLSVLYITELSYVNCQREK